MFEFALYLIYLEKGNPVDISFTFQLRYNYPCISIDLTANTALEITSNMVDFEIHHHFCFIIFWFFIVIKNLLDT